MNGQMVGSSAGNTDDICRLGEARAEVTELREKVGSGEKWPGKGRRGPQGAQGHRHQTGDHFLKKETVDDVT